MNTSSWQQVALKEWASHPRQFKGDKNKSILVRVTPELHIALKELALIHRISMQDLIEQFCLSEISAIVRKSNKRKVAR
jgi:hypothetical protein